MKVVYAQNYVYILSHTMLLLNNITHSSNRQIIDRQVQERTELATDPDQTPKYFHKKALLPDKMEGTLLPSTRLPDLLLLY